MIRLFRVSIPSSILALVLLDTILLFSCYYVSGQFAWFDPETFLLYEGGLQQILIVVVVIELGFYFSDLYEAILPSTRTILVQQVCLTVGIAFLFQAMLGYARSNLQLPRLNMMLGSLSVLIVMPLWRIGFAAYMRRASAPRKVLFLGASPVVREVLTRLEERPDLGLKVVGYLDNCPVADACKMPFLGKIEDLEHAIVTYRPDRIVVGLREEIDAALPVDRLLDLRFSGKMEVEQASKLYERIYSRVAIYNLRPSQLLFAPELVPHPFNLTLQGIYSPLLGLLGVLVTLPIMAVVAVLVKVSSPGPVFYRQVRMGLNGKPFRIFKFRSMYANAEARTGAVWATKGDPRVTPLGRWLRYLRLDELPQFFNVVRGEMALVGPRPERPEFAEVLEHRIPLFRQRMCVKPGITGWAQINYGYGETVEDAMMKLEYDLYYIKNLSLTMDAYIIFHTLKVMLLSRGSH